MFRDSLLWNYMGTIMRGVLKLASVKRSTPSMAAALPNLPMPQAVMVRLVRILASTMTAYYEPVFRRIGLTENIFHVLCLLLAADKGEASPGELTELVGTSKANMSRILEQLARDGLVSRTPESMDARRHVIKITAKGRKIATEAVPKMLEPLSKAFTGLTAEEFITLNTLIQKAILSLDTGGITLQQDE
ncbi:MAG: MarR family transcriptional regulator [Rhodocyclaceae bacterium]|nr:MarR family transcriptional regulator [Rhodocyclaceae bacterium]